MSTVPPPVISAPDLRALLDGDGGDAVVVLEIRRERATIPGPVALGLVTPPAGHLPGAHLVDFAELIGPRTESSGHAPLPEPSALGDLLTRTGIHETSLVVVYSADLASSASRAWWVLRWAGLPDVRYLDGGVHGWIADGGALTETRPVAGGGTAQVRPGGMPTLDADSAAALARAGHLLDARRPGVYAGTAQDEVGGHIPGAHSVPGEENLRDGYLADDEALRAHYAPYLAGAPIGAYCGGGVAATLDVLALSTLGVTAALYPGSWSQWITDPARPIATGVARG